MLEHKGSGQDRSDFKTPKPKKRFPLVVGVGIGLGIIILVSLGVIMLGEFINLGGGSESTPEILSSEDQVIEEVEETLQPPAIDGPDLPDYDMTATAACYLFSSQFPGTPCPATAVLGIEATATAACAQFQSQFPGTPCP
jgi:hypothetical protein